jgi:hypothetical protein
MTDFRQCLALQFAVNRETTFVLAMKWAASAQAVTSADVTQRCFCVELMIDAALLHAIRDMIGRVMLVKFIDHLTITVGLVTSLVSIIVGVITLQKLFGSPFFHWIPPAAPWLCIAAMLLGWAIFRLWHDDWKWRVLKIEDLLS